jgi:hypothetical protein
MLPAIIEELSSGVLVGQLWTSIPICLPQPTPCLSPSHSTLVCALARGSADTGSPKTAAYQPSQNTGI